MKIETIGDIFEAHESASRKFEALVAALSDERAGRVPEGEAWSVAQIVEHVSLVDEGSARICAKLLSKAESDGAISDGHLEISADFFTRSEEIAEIKIEAPERVHPNAGLLIADSLERLRDSAESFARLRPAFEKFDSWTYKFPHPFFGDISAAEWLLVAAGHKARHLQQIRSIVDKI